MDNDIVSIVLGAVGGSTAVIGGLAAWLGKIWATRIEEAERAKSSAEIERLKSSLDMAIAREQRNSDAQFKLYNEVWSELQDLKLAATYLWDQATEERYHSFLGALLSASRAVDKGRLVLSDRDYARLRTILGVFEQFEIGKKRLLDIRSSEEFRNSYHNDSQGRIDAHIQQNRHTKEEYESLIEDIVHGFKKKLGLT